jgi:hypothetical protein
MDRLSVDRAKLDDALEAARRESDYVNQFLNKIDVCLSSEQLDWSRKSMPAKTGAYEI